MKTFTIITWTAMLVMMMMMMMVKTAFAIEGEQEQPGQVGSAFVLILGLTKNCTSDAKFQAAHEFIECLAGMVDEEQEPSGVEDFPLQDLLENLPISFREGFPPEAVSLPEGFPTTLQEAMELLKSPEQIRNLIEISLDQFNNQTLINEYLSYIEVDAEVKEFVLEVLNRDLVSSELKNTIREYAVAVLHGDITKVSELVEAGLDVLGELNITTIREVYNEQLPSFLNPLMIDELEQYINMTEYEEVKLTNQTCDAIKDTTMFECVSKFNGASMGDFVNAVLSGFRKTDPNNLYCTLMKATVDQLYNAAVNVTTGWPVELQTIDVKDNFEAMGIMVDSVLSEMDEVCPADAVEAPPTNPGTSKPTNTENSSVASQPLSAIVVMSSVIVVLMSMII